MTTTVAAPNVAGAIETVESHLHPTPSWDLAQHPVPTGREEIWRFTPVKKFRKLFRTDAATGGVLTLTGELPEGITRRDITKEEARELSVEAPVDRVAALAHEFAANVALVDVADEFSSEDPVRIKLEGEGSTVLGHTIIRIGKFAKVTLVLHYVGSGTFAEKTDIIVGEGAQVNFVTLQDWADGAIHGGQRSLIVGRDAHVKTVTASLGGDVVRLQENSSYAGPGGELESYGIYFVDGDQHIQHRLFVDHNEPHTKSDVDYRGALQGKGAHAVWIGDVLIRKAAEQIETFESNKNLLLTGGCRADSVPNLEIETGEIADAGHASSTGRFDEEQLFYMKSRGIPEKEARRLVVHGFFWEIIRRIDVDEIEEKLLERVEQELELLEHAQDGA